MKKIDWMIGNKENIEIVRKILNKYAHKIKTADYF